MKRRHVLLRSLFLVIFIGTGELFKTGKATQRWVTVKSSVKRCQRMEVSNFRVKMITFLLRLCWLSKAFQQQTAVFHCVNVCVDWPLFVLPTTTTGVSVCVDWPLFALPTSITGDYHPPDTLIVYHRVRKCKFSKCLIAYYYFDTVEYNILLEALNTLGLGGRVSKWFRSYLSGCSQRILVRGCLSKKFDLNCGVPQGSCLGPLLFTIYTSSLLDVVEKYLPSVHCYADDTQLYVSFRPADETDETGHLDAITAINCCIKAIGCWMRENKLLLNEEKTEFLLIGTKQQLAKVDIGHIKVGKVNIAPHSPVKNLGVWFDSNLSMVDHITKTCSAAFYYLCNIRRIRKYLTK